VCHHRGGRGADPACHGETRGGTGEGPCGPPTPRGSKALEADECGREAAGAAGREGTEGGEAGELFFLSTGGERQGFSIRGQDLGRARFCQAEARP
jgi:hypothetical protein